MRTITDLWCHKQVLFTRDTSKPQPMPPYEHYGCSYCGDREYFISLPSEESPSEFEIASVCAACARLGTMSLNSLEDGLVAVRIHLSPNPCRPCATTRLGAEIKKMDLGRYRRLWFILEHGVVLNVAQFEGIGLGLSLNKNKI